MAYSAKIVCDSVGPHGIRLTTMEQTGWRPVHSEFMTHRMFSRNSASSRALPHGRFREQVLYDPALPVFWGSHQSGMQSFSELVRQQEVLDIWNQARIQSIVWHEKLEQLGLAKQIANRLLEPWMWITRVVTGTNFAWANYFHLRCHYQAQHEAAEEAFKAADAYFSSIPKSLDYGEWHLPYIHDSEKILYENEALVKLSSARCARISFVRQNEIDYKKELAIYARLTNPNTPREFDPEEPIHSSPLEHPAECTYESILSGNFKGWLQHRKEIPNEMRKEFTKEDLERRRTDRFERYGL